MVQSVWETRIRKSEDMQMKKLLCCFLMLFMVFALAACQSKVEAEYHVSSFDGEKLYIECDGNTVVYERYKPGVGSLTKKTMLDMFIYDTEIDGVVCKVYSTEEHPDLSYVLLIYGTNNAWTFRISEQTP